MWKGGGQLEPPEAAAYMYQPQCRFRWLFAALSHHVPCRNGAEKRNPGLVCGSIRGTEPPHTRGWCMHTTFMSQFSCTGRLWCSQ